MLDEAAQCMRNRMKSVAECTVLLTLCFNLPLFTIWMSCRNIFSNIPLELLQDHPITPNDLILSSPSSVCFFRFFCTSASGKYHVHVIVCDCITVYVIMMANEYTVHIKYMINEYRHMRYIMDKTKALSTAYWRRVHFVRKY